MDNPELTKQQKQALDSQLKRADAFEGMTKTKGWDYILAYFQDKVQAFTSGILTSKEDIGKFESERNKISGIREMIGFINSDLEALKRFREDGRNKSNNTQS